MDDRHESRVMLAVLKGDWPGVERLIEQRPVDDALFVEVCRQSAVHGRIHALAEAAEGWKLLGQAARQDLTRMRDKIRMDNILWLARVEQALDLLKDVGVTPIGLKGLDTLHRFYDDFDQRTVDDCDLLIRRDQLEATLQALLAAGFVLPAEAKTNRYIRASHHLPIRSPGRVPVDFEIHWNLAQEGRYSVDVDGLFERSVALDVAGRQILRLEDHDLVAHLLLHHFSHYFGRGLKWLVDLEMIVDQDGFAWTTVADRIDAWGATIATGASLAHLRKLWPELIPSEMLDRFPISWWRGLLTRPLRSGHPLELYQGSGGRKTQLYLAAVLMERPAAVPGWVWHRAFRDRRPGSNPLDPGASTG